MRHSGIAPTPAKSTTALGVTDSMRWRKYGTKATMQTSSLKFAHLTWLGAKVIRKARPQLRRDYFRCTVRGCLVKRYVDRAEGDDNGKVRRKAFHAVDFRTTQPRFDRWFAIFGSRSSPSTACTTTPMMADR